MALSSNDRFFLVGETVHLRVRVSAPGTRTPVDASVALTALKREGTLVPVADTAFTRMDTGDYLLVIPTAGREPGAYEVTITVSDGPSKVSILQDRFALRTA